MNDTPVTLHFRPSDNDWLIVDRIVEYYKREGLQLNKSDALRLALHAWDITHHEPTDLSHTQTQGE